jgi:hypothetical protein
MKTITIAGNIGAEPEFKQDGTARLSFRVAVNTWTKAAGEQTTISASESSSAAWIAASRSLDEVMKTLSSLENMHEHTPRV